MSKPQPVKILRYVGDPSWTGFRWTWVDSGLGLEVGRDMTTNQGYNNYEQVLHILRIGPLQWRWYTL